MRLGGLNDPMGQMLLAQLEHGDAYEIVERDGGLIDAMPAVRYFLPFSKWPSYERRAMRFVRGQVLDIGCGAGRHCLYLQARGFDVMGIDASPGAVEVTRRRGVRQVRLLSIEDVSPALGIFDAVLLMGNNFGLLRSATKSRQILRKLARATSPSGRIIAEVRDPYRTTDPEHLAYHSRNRSRGRLGGQLRLRVRYRYHAPPWFDYLFASPEEVRKIVGGSEWRVRAFLDDGGPQYCVVLDKA